MSETPLNEAFPEASICRRHGPRPVPEDFNTARSHSATGYITPAAYAATLKPHGYQR